MIFIKFLVIPQPLALLKKKTIVKEYLAKIANI
jgi:hypothetical protein